MNCTRNTIRDTVTFTQPNLQILWTPSWLIQKSKIVIKSSTMALLKVQVCSPKLRSEPKKTFDVNWIFPVGLEIYFAQKKMHTQKDSILYIIYLYSSQTNWWTGLHKKNWLFVSRKKRRWHVMTWPSSIIETQLMTIAMAMMGFCIPAYLLYLPRMYMYWCTFFTRLACWPTFYFGKLIGASTNKMQCIFYQSFTQKVIITDMCLHNHVCTLRLLVEWRNFWSVNK